MICKSCGSAQDHAGIYCSICGSCSVHFQAPDVVYFRGGNIELSISIEHPFEDALRLAYVTIGRKKVNVERDLIKGQRVLRIPVDETDREISKVETYAVSALVKRAGDLLRIDAGEIRYSPTPIVRIESLTEPDGDPIMVDISHSRGNCYEVGVTLKKDSIFGLDEIRLKTVTDPTNEFGRKERSFVAKVVGSQFDVQPGELYSVALDFSAIYDLGIPVVDLQELEFGAELVNRYGEDLDWVESSGKTVPSFKFRFLGKTEIQLAVWRSTDYGFTYLVHNKAFVESRSSSRSGSSAIALTGFYMDRMSEAEIEQEFLDRIGIETTLQDLASRRVRLRVPLGKQRKRRFSLFLNYAQNPGISHDTKSNFCRITLSLSKSASVDRKALYDSIWYRKLGGTSEVRIGGTLDLGNQIELEGFDLYFALPLNMTEESLEFDLRIERYNCINDSVIDDVTYSVQIDCYRPEENPAPIAIDFGTTSTCVVGPHISDGNLRNEPTAYRLDYFHSISRSSEATIPTAVAYRRSESLDDYYIPDVLAEPRNSYLRFKLDLMKYSPASRIEDSVSPTRLAADFFSALFELIEIYYEDRDCPYTDFKDVVATCPVSFVPEQRLAVEKDIQQALSSRHLAAGSKGPRFAMDIDEPTAALVFAEERQIHSSPSVNRDVLRLSGVLDVGGGTVDTALILFSDSGAHLVGTGGSREIGGNTFDLWVYRRLISKTTTSEQSIMKEIVLRNSNMLLDDPGSRHFRVDQSLVQRVSEIKKSFGANPDAVDKGRVARVLSDKLDEAINVMLLSGSDGELAEKLSDDILRLLKDEDLRKKFFAALSEDDIEGWTDPTISFINMLLPFYRCLYRQLKEILWDTLAGASDKIAEIAADKQCDLCMLLAGNASRIRCLESIVSQILADLEDRYEWLNSTQVKILNPPKECVGYGAYISRQQVTLNLRKSNNPPFTLFKPVLFPDTIQERNLLRRIGNRHIIVIFDEGERSASHRKSSWYLLKAFRMETLAAKRSDEKIYLSHKIGVDETSDIYRIECVSEAPDKLLLVLDQLNRVSVIAFGTADEIGESQVMRRPVETDPEFDTYLKETLDQLH